MSTCPRCVFSLNMVFPREKDDDDSNHSHLHSADFTIALTITMLSSMNKKSWIMVNWL